MRRAERELKKLDDRIAATSEELAHAFRIEEGAFVLIDTFFSYFESAGIEEAGSNKMVDFWTWHRRCLMLDAIIPVLTHDIEKMMDGLAELEDKRSQLVGGGSIPKKGLEREEYLGRQRYAQR